MHPGQLLEVFVSELGAWSIVVSTGSGWSCNVTTGEASQEIEYRPGA